MIKYNLKCKNKHEFESWFSDSKEFEKLLKKKLIECLFCKTKSVKKSIIKNLSNQNFCLNFPKNRGFATSLGALVEFKKTRN